MKIGVIGSGQVGKTLASGFLKHGHEVMIGTRNRERLIEWQKQNPAGRIGSFADCAAFGDLAVLAVKGSAALDAIRTADPRKLAGKTVIDTTNPLSDAPPVNGVLRYFTSLDESLLELLQRGNPDIHFVKAFNSVGAGLMVSPRLEGGKPTMFICGNSDEAKKAVTGILDQFDWETADLGKAEAARAIEPLCMLWCIRGFLHNDWSHALKLLK